MDRLEEMLRLEEVGNAIKRIVIDEYGAKQRLLGFDVMRRRAGRGLRRDWYLLACNRIDLCHGSNQEIRMWPICGRPLGSRWFFGHSTSRMTQRQRHSSANA